VLRQFGAKTNYSIHYDHEYWRLMTPIFIHLNLPHLLINMYSLWVIGPWVEKLYGSAKFVVFWVATGIAGVFASFLSVWPDAHPGILTSFLIKRGDGPSAGASGALFGLVGVLFVFGIKYRRELPEGFKRAFGTGMLPVIILNLGIGFLGRGFIDNAAHLGGLLSGAALAGAFSYKRPGESARVTMAWRVVQIGSLILVAGCFLMAARAHQRNPQGSLSAEMATRKAEYEAFETNHNVLQAGQVAFVDALTKNNPGGIDQATAQLDKIQHTDAETDALRTELKELLVRAQKFVSDWRPPKQMTPEGNAERQRLTDDYKQWQERYKNWFWSEGGKFGLQRPASTPASASTPAN
jgi:membrane associated rhomboid family serine protease